jgi:putative spermidine/putrescine transport system permease protein
MLRAYAWLVLGLLYLPLVPVVWSSFARRAYLVFPPRHLSLHWYAHIGASFWTASAWSVALAAATGLVGAIIGTGTALALGRRRANRLRGLFMLPLQVPGLVIGVLYLQFYFLLLRNLHFTLFDTPWGVLLAHVVATTPYTLSAVGAVLAAASLRDAEDAARSLGATEWRVLRRVTLPLLLPGMLSGAFYAFVISFDNVPISLFLTSTRFTTLPVLIFNTLQFNFDNSILALSALLVVFSLLFVLLVNRAVGLDRLLHGGASQ